MSEYAASANPHANGAAATGFGAQKLLLFGVPLAQETGTSPVRTDVSTSNEHIVTELLENALDREVVYRLMAAKSTYMSLTFANPELKRLMPWAGIHEDGREGVLFTFRTLNTFWTIDDFVMTTIFGAGDDVAVFGTFTVRSKRLDKTFTSPFSVYAKIENGQIIHLQYMEDTFGTGSTFRSSGKWTFAGDPTGVEVEVGD